MASLAGCAGTSPGGSTSRAVTVAAAASLTDVLEAERVAFVSAHPGVRVRLTFGSSSTLAAQIIGGAPVDVFASADQPNMKKVADAGLLAASAVPFATNSLQIVVRKGNPSAITSVADLTRPGLVYVTCAEDVPIGRYAMQVLRSAGVNPTPRSLEPDVRGIVAKVAAGEADAGIVYATDVRAAGDSVTGVDIPTTVNVTASYPVAMLRDASDADAARAWIDFLLSPEGRAILEQFGFGAP